MFEVAIKWPEIVYDASVFSNSLLNKKLRDGTIRKFSKNIVPREPAVSVSLLNNITYPLLSYIIKEFSNDGKNNEDHFFGYRLSSARMVIECAFGRLKARFGCLNRNMDINLKDLPNVIYACFVLHNFCKIHKELILQNDGSKALKNDVQFQPQTYGDSLINNNEENRKAVRNTFVKYFNGMFERKIIHS